MESLRAQYQRLRHSRVGPAVSAGPRLALAASYGVAPAKNCLRWLYSSRESTNLTYDVTPLNRVNLAWWVSAITSRPFAEITTYFSELEADTALADHIATTTANSEQLRVVYDGKPRFGRRIAWYALVRATRPSIVIETGTDVGLGSLVLAAALLRNEAGQLITIDNSTYSGGLIGGDYAGVVTKVIGDSIAVLEQQSESVDLFIHDSFHTYDHECAELDAVEPRLSQHALVLSDNAHGTTACADWALRTNRQFLFTNESPKDHWYPGAGIGAAWRP